MMRHLYNQIASYRARMATLDKEENAAIWKDQPPVKFTDKVAETRTALTELIEMRGKQALGTKGITADKLRERRELEREGHTLGGALVAFALDSLNETLAARHDLTPTNWRLLRDGAVVGQARLLADDSGLLINPETATPEKIAEAAAYGITPESVARLQSEAADFESRIASTRIAINDRKLLRAALPGKSRDVRAHFRTLEMMLPQFERTPAGKRFVRHYYASGVIVDR